MTTPRPLVFLAAVGALYVPSCERMGAPSFEEGPSVLEAFTIATP